MIGRVVKGIGGFYFVHDGQQAVMGKARGILKRGKEIIYVGDIVDYDIDDNDSDNECVINFVTERRNYLTRPPVSNLDILVVVFSLVNPEVNYPVIDKLLAGAERAGIRPVICISKKDLVSREDLETAIARFRFEHVSRPEQESETVDYTESDTQTAEFIKSAIINESYVSDVSSKMGNQNSIEVPKISHQTPINDAEIHAADMINTIYSVIFVNGSTGEGLDELWEQIRGKNAALAGPSGVGKSTITNWLLSNYCVSQINGNSISEDSKNTIGFNCFNVSNKSHITDYADNSDASNEQYLASIIDGSSDGKESDNSNIRIKAVETGTVSEKTGRGRHTTRHVEIFPLDGGTWLYDTPGFTSLELQGALPGEIGLVLPEIRELSAGCRYRNCIHINEPDCAVKEALEDGRISKSRYESYRIMVDEAEAEQTRRRR